MFTFDIKLYNFAYTVFMNTLLGVLALSVMRNLSMLCIIYNYVPLYHDRGQSVFLTVGNIKPRIHQ